MLLGILGDHSQLMFLAALIAVPAVMHKKGRLHALVQVFQTLELAGDI